MGAPFDYAGMVVSAGATAQGLTTTAAKLTPFSHTGGANAQAGSNTDGAASVRPDTANNRLLLKTPGIYQVELQLSALVDGAGDLMFQLYKNGVAIGDAVARAAAALMSVPLTASLSPAQVAANTTAEQSFTGFSNVASDIFVGASKPTAQAGIGIVGGRVIDGTHIGLTFCNNTAGGITPTASETYTVTVLRGGRVNVKMNAIIKLTTADNPGTIADWTYTGTYGDSGGAPQDLCPLEIYGKILSGTVNLTPEYVNFTAKRVG